MSAARRERGVPVVAALAAAAALVVAAVAVAFAPARTAELLNFDDDQNLALNHAFRGLGAQHLRWMFTTAWMGHYQPLSWLSFALDHRVHGFTAPDHPEAGLFHRTSVLLHAATAVLVLVLARRVLLLAASERARDIARGSAGIAAACAAALLFAVHPLRVESVVWLTERRDVLSAPLLVLALLAWLRHAGRSPPPPAGARALIGIPAASAAAVALALASLRLPPSGALELQGPGASGLLAAAACLGLATWLAGGAGRVAFGAAVALLALSLLAKAWGITFPLVLLILDAWPLRRWRARADLVRLVLEKLPFAVLAVVFARLAAWAQSTQAGTMRTLAEHGPGERAVQALYGLAYYPLRTLAPRDLVPIHELPEQLSLLEPRFALAAGAVLAAAAACVLLRRRLPALAAACAAYAVIVAPVLGLAQSGPQLVADRYSHLATLPFALLAAGGLLELHARSPRAAAGPWLAAGLAIAVLGVQTRRLSESWRTSASLWRRAAELQPESTTAALSLGHVLEAEARAAGPERRRELLDQAAALYARGHARRPDPRFLLNLAGVEAARAKLDPEARPERLAGSVRLAREAMQLAGERGVLTPEYRFDFGTYLFESGLTDAGLEHLRWYVEARPDDPRGRFNLAVALQRLERPREALTHAEQLVARSPRHADGWALLGQLREAVGEPGAARAAYARALQIAPGHGLAAARAAALAP